MKGQKCPILAAGLERGGETLTFFTGLQAKETARQKSPHDNEEVWSRPILNSRIHVSVM